MSDLCQCGHDARHHAFGKCNAHACCGNEKCDTTFLTDPDAPPADRDDLAAILAKHRLLDQFQRTGLSVVVNHACSCGDWNHPAGGDWPEAHRAHVAQMVLESDWLRDVKAEAWDECIKPFRHYGFTNRNPYRADRVDAEDTDNTTDRTYKIPD